MSSEQTTMDGQRARAGCFSCLLNLLTIFVALAGIAVVFVVGASVVAPNFLANTPLRVFSFATTPQATPTVAAVAALPTATQTPTPSLVPTFTPLPVAATPLPQFTRTLRPSRTPTPIPTFPTRTPTKTPTPTPSNTPTETPIGPSPTASATRSAFVFTKTDTSPFYLQNFANSAGCDWLGVAGEVLDLNRNPVANGSYVVHVWGNAIDERVAVGSAPDYSLSGWEQFLFNAPVVRDYNVQLETPNGTPVSQVYRIQTRASCNQNLLRLDFVQNH